METKGITLQNRDKTKIYLPQTNAVLVLTETGNVQEALDSLQTQVNNALNRFKSVFETVSALETAHPTGEAGDWAIVDSEGENAQKYMWDDTDSSWILMGAYSGVETVNGKSGIVTLVGSDIDSTLSIDGSASTQTITQWLQSLKDDLDNLDATQINAIINEETKSVQEFLQDLKDTSFETIIDLKDETNFQPYLETGKKQVFKIKEGATGYPIKTVYASGLNYLIEIPTGSANPSLKKGYSPFIYEVWIHNSSLGYAIKMSSDAYGFDNGDNIKLEVTTSGTYSENERLKISLTDAFIQRITDLENNKVEQGEIDTSITNHNTDETSHTDIRNILENNTTDIYVDGNRADTYTANGSYNYPFKTINEAIAVANNKDTIKVKTATYTEDCVFPAGVSLKGDKLVGTIISGDVTFESGGTPITILNIDFTGDSKTVTINGTAVVRDSYSYNPIVIGGHVTTNNFDINTSDDVPAITVDTTGHLTFTSGGITTTLNRAIHHITGSLVLSNAQLQTSDATKEVLYSEGGTVKINFSSFINAGGGVAVDTTNNDAIAANPNVISSLRASGNVNITGGNVDLVGVIKFVVIGELNYSTQPNFISADNVAYDSSKTVKEEVDNKADISDLPKEETLTLLSANWDTNEYTFDLTGTDLEDLDGYLFTLNYILASRDDFITADIYIKSVSLNQIVFGCTTEPTEDIDVKIIYQKAGE
jgi:hypothetical protein